MRACLRNGKKCLRISLTVIIGECVNACLCVYERLRTWTCSSETGFILIEKECGVPANQPHPRWRLNPHLLFLSVVLSHNGGSGFPTPLLFSGRR